jgi:hypothetical protein
VFLIVGALLAAIVLIPQLAIDPHGLSRTDWLKAVQDLRATILQGLGGLAVVAGAIVAALNLRETGRQNRAVLELQRRGQVTERFTLAIEQLGRRGDDNLDVRIGAVYALEQIARDSAELHWPIMEVLTAYLREHAPIAPDVQPAPQSTPAADATPDGAASDSDAVTKRTPADHQAIATVIGRRRVERDPPSRFGRGLDLSRTDLSGVVWDEAHLEGASLVDTRLERASLIGAHLEEAILFGAHLEGATLFGAHLKGMDLFEVHLECTNLHDTHLEEASLRGAHLEGAILDSTHLEGAILDSTHLEGAILDGAHLEGAILMGTHLEEADLRGAQGLTYEQLQEAMGWERAQLPAALAARLADAAASPPVPARQLGQHRQR